MEIQYLQEPLIEFANDFLCEDPKKGIEAMGFYSISNKSHKSQIQYSVIGTKKQISDYKSWIDKFSNPIESTKNYKPKSLKVSTTNGDDPNDDDDETIDIESLFDDEDFDSGFEEDIESGEIINKKANPDFPGFNSESCFKCEFLNDGDDYTINSSTITEIIESEKKQIEKLNDISELYTNCYLELIENTTGRPDIIILIIGKDVFKKIGTFTLGNVFHNLRRKIKADILATGKNIPIQIILENTIDGTKKSLQDLSMIAWNFCVAQYYKTANCTPWTIRDIDADTCYLGISFHKINEKGKNHLRSSIAQAFNKDGKGLVFTGKQFEWRSEKTKVATPHLKYAYAKELIINVLNQYKLLNKHTPKRIVIHKTSDFWDAYVNPDYNELDGIVDGIKESLGEDIEYDLVTIKNSQLRLLRNSDYPVLRGTLLKVSNDKAFLYSNGFIPYYDTYPGAYVPMPLSVENIGETPIVEICQEILALTKMNFNNCSYCDGLPITIQFSKKVGEIIQYFPKDLENPPNKYFFYM